MNSNDKQKHIDFIEDKGTKIINKFENSTKIINTENIKDKPNDKELSEYDPGTLTLKERIILALQDIYDPEIPVNIYDLGLIYDILIVDHHKVFIKMTLTSPMCPVAQTFPETVQNQILLVEGVSCVKVELVWEPQWTKERMSEAVRLELNLF